VDFSDLTVGASAALDRTVTDDDIAAFAAVTGDTNPVHLDDSYARGTRFGGRIAHGMWTAGLVSAVLGTRLPGPGAIYLSQTLRFTRPVRPGDTVTAQVTITALDPAKRRATFATTCRTQDGALVLDGEAVLWLPEAPAP
jgi:3-hydroxybutyryl-CoA dehydratase